MRKLASKHPKERGMYGLSKLIQKYEPGQKVAICIDPTYISSAPHKRYQGLSGTVVGRRGRAYIIEVYTGRKKRKLMVNLEHLKPLAS